MIESAKRLDRVENRIGMVIGSAKRLDRIENRIRMMIGSDGDRIGWEPKLKKIGSAPSTHAPEYASFIPLEFVNLSQSQIHSLDNSSALVDFVPIDD